MQSQPPKPWPLFAASQRPELNSLLLLLLLRWMPTGAIAATTRASFPHHRHHRRECDEQRPVFAASSGVATAHCQHHPQAQRRANCLAQTRWQMMTKLSQMEQTPCECLHRLAVATASAAASSSDSGWWLAAEPRLNLRLRHQRRRSICAERAASELCAIVSDSVGSRRQRPSRRLWNRQHARWIWSPSTLPNPAPTRPYCRRRLGASAPADRTW